MTDPAEALMDATLRALARCETCFHPAHEPGLCVKLLPPATPWSLAPMCRCGERVPEDEPADTGPRTAGRGMSVEAVRRENE